MSESKNEGFWRWLWEGMKEMKNDLPKTIKEPEIEMIGVILLAITLALVSSFYKSVLLMVVFTGLLILGMLHVEYRHQKRNLQSYDAKEQEQKER